MTAAEFKAALKEHGFEKSEHIGWKDTTGAAPGTLFMPVFQLKPYRIHWGATLERMLQRRNEVTRSMP